MTRRSPSPSSAMPTSARTPGHGQLQQFRRGRTAAQVDVPAVGRAADRDDLRAEVREHARRDFVAGAVGAVDHDLEAGEIDARRQRRGAEILVATARLVDTRGLAERVRLARQRRLVQVRLDLLLEFVGQLAAVRVEELDAVVFVQVVRRADDDAEAAAELLRQVGDARASAAGRSASH